MTSGEPLVIEALSASHDRKPFSCGVAALDTYIRQQARQDIKRRISRVFVARSHDQPRLILGYYTLSSLSIDLAALPSEMSRKLPRHPIPAALLGRLAVNENARGTGIGKMLLMDAITRTFAVSAEIAIYAMVVDAIDAEAARFYQQYGFLSLNQDGRRLFLPLKSIETIK